MDRKAVLRIGSIWGIVLILLTVLPLGVVEARPLAQPTTDVSLNISAETMLGQPFTFTVTFDNNGTVPGYGPFIDLIFPATGADGDDGLTFNGATYLGVPLSSVVLTFPAPTGCVAHPYAVDTSGAPVQVCGTPGDQLVVLLLPFGSFVPDQPPVEVVVNVNMSNYADVGTPLNIQARGGYQFGETPVSDPATDPSIIGAWTVSSTTPTLIRVTKTYLGPEDETATGPNFPRTYRITVDIAAGQTITGLTVTDLLPPNLAFLAVTSISPGGAVILDQPVTPGAQLPPNNDLVVQWASVTGGAGTADAVVEFTFYAPLNDAGGNPVLNPVTGDDVPSLNDSRGEGNWTPLDPRDTSGLVISNLPPSDYTLTLKSIAIQKSVSNLSPAPLSPGDTLEYTLQVQVSDFFALTDLVIDDLFSDGQAWDATFTPVLSVTEHGATTSAPMNSANYTVLPNVFLGFSEVTFRVSSELQSRGLDRILLGGCVPDGGTGGPAPDCASFNGGATTLTLRFRTVVQENFVVNYPSGDPSVDQGDILNNLVTVMSNVLNVANLTPTGEDEQDSSQVETSIPRGTVEKTIYAVNGVACSPQPCTAVRVAPADTVTYRLRYVLPTSDVENLYLIDYLPLPVFLATEVTTFDPTVSAAAPPPGQAKFGPADTFYVYSGIVPTLLTNSSENSLRFTYGSYDDVRNQSTVVDLLFTVTVRSDPFADGLYLTNQVRGREGATNAGDSVADSVVQIQLTQPVLNVRKGVVWSENAGAVFNPAQVAPAGVTFSGAGCPRFTGTVNSSGLASQPIDSNITGGVDAGDRVTFAITVENTGSGLNGAFDLRVADSLPAGMTFVPGSLCVTDGTGAAIGYTGAETDLFATGIVLNDPGPTANPAGALDPYDPTSGRNIAVITFDVTLDGTVQVQNTLTNTGRLTAFAGSEGGANHVPSGVSETASVSVARPSTAKTLIGTEINSATNGNTQAVIGELVTYEVTVTVPEGVLPSAVLTDTLDSGLAFVDCLSITASPDLSTDLVGGFAAACNDPTNPTVSAGGGTVTFNLGTITNANRDNAQAETLTIRYTAVVLNVTGNQAGTQLNNLAGLSWSGGSLGAVSAPNLTVIEPNIITGKSRLPSGNLDAGDVVTFTITLTNPNGATDTDAYDVVMTDVVPALLTYVPGSFLVASCSAGAPVLNDSAAPTLTATFAVFPRNTSCELRFQATVNNTVRAGNPDVINTAVTTWTSLSGSPGDRSPYNTSSEERDGSGAPLNDYQSSASANVSFASTVTSKFLVATSEGHTSGNAVVIGEIVRYRLVVSVPEGTQNNFQVFDNLPLGLTFLNDGTATIAFVSNGAGFTSTGVGIVPAIPAGCTITGNAANATNPPSPLPCTLADGNIGSTGSTSSNVDNFVNLADGSQTGVDVYFKLGNLVNADSDADNEFVVIEFNAVVDNTGGGSNDAGDTRGNFARTFINGTSNSISGTVNVVVAEPLLTISKSASVASGDAGDPVTFTITVGAQSGANRVTAFDLVVSDTLDGYLVPGTVSVTSSQGATCAGGTPFNATASFAGQVMTMNATCLDPGQTITITIDATISPSAPNGFSINNTATLTYTSLPGSGTPLAGSVPPGGYYYGERDGSQTPNSSNDYRASSTAVIVATNSPQIVKSVSPSSYTIGDLVTYNLLVTLPEGVTQALVVTDDIPVGLEVESYQIITSAASSGGLLAADYNGALPVPTVTQAGGSGGDITFNFGDTPTTADNVANNNAFLIRITARVLNIAGNVDGVIRTNTATVTYNGPAVPSSSANITIIEPTITTTKSVTPNANVQAGDVLTYTVRFTNTGNSPAYDVTAVDTLAQGVAYQTGSASCQFFDGTSTAPIAVSVTDNGATLLFEGVPAGSWDIPATNPDAFIECTYQAVALSSLHLDGAHVNTVDADWSSHDGSDAFERVYDDTTPYPNDGTQDTASAAFTSPAPVFTKSDGGLTQATIGQVISYTLTVQSPLGTLRNLIITDTLPAGLIYQTGSLSVGAGITAPVSVMVSSPNDGSAPVTLTIDFGDAVISSSPVTLTFTAQVANVAGNQQGVSLNNTASLTYTDASGTSRTLNASDPVTLVEPVITLSKTVVPPTPADAGGVATYTLVLSNPGGANVSPAYDVRLTDTLPAVLTLDTGSVNVILAGGASGVTDASVGNTLDITIAVIPPGGSATVTFTATLNDTLTPGQTVANTADVVWSSLSGTVSGERDGSGGINDYQTSASANFTSAGYSLSKALISTSAGHTSGASLTIGETVTFELAVSLPEGTIPAPVVVTDDLPAGLAYVSGSGVLDLTGFNGTVDSVDPTVASVGGSGDDVIFTFNQPIQVAPDNDPANNVLRLRLTAVVVNELANQNGVTLNNAASLRAGGGPLVQATPVTMTLVEPDLALSKTASTLTPGLGQVVTFTLTIAHSAASTTDAQDVVLTDVIPAGLTYVPGSLSSSGYAPTVLDDSGAPDLLVRWDTLPLGQTGVISYQAQVTTPGFGTTMTNNAGLVWTSLSGSDSGERDGSGGVNDYVRASAVTLTSTGPDLQISKSDGDVSTTPGGTVTYTLSYSNTGNGVATGVVVSETVPDHTTFVGPAGWTCLPDNNAGSVCTYNLGTLNPGVSGTLTVQVQVVNPLPAGVTQIQNVVYIADDGTHGNDPTPGNNTGSDETPVEAAPDLTVSKTDGGVTATPGDVVAYTLSYANVGNQAATNVVLTETVPAHSVFNAGASTVGWTCVPDNNAGSTCTLSLGTLAGGASGTAVFAVTVDNPLPAGVTQIANTVVISDDGANGADPTPGNNTGSDETPVDAAPDLTVSKTDGGVTATPGDVVAYTLSY
ncbi:isopeptide-forming domain-containing fimbrial protein, partial [Anaerolinea sp.]|uniref:isopeptide-forming domain-containing fimbrial protein n=1 Tax=Anaerolinea sp. TaxID=1872519 RepID=UPI002FDA342A